MREICRAALAAAVAIAIPVMVLAAPAGGAQSSAQVARVSVKDDVFSPKVARVDVGGKVIWRWKGSNDHDIKFRSAPAGAKLPSGAAARGIGRFSRTFRKRGTYRYVCTLHEDDGMTGRVVAK